MNSYSMEHLARQRISDLAADARGDRLALASSPIDSGRSTADEAAAVHQALAWIRSVVVRHRRDAVRSR